MTRDRWRRELPNLLMIGLSAVVVVVQGQAQELLPTPEVSGFERVDAVEIVGYVMRAEVADTDVIVGLSLVCEGPGDVEVVVYFGGFPSTRQPVQLAVRDVAGRVERFGPVVTGGPEAGFHSPRLTELPEVERFMRIALRPGSLVSNGYRSFWNRASAADNQQVLDEFAVCMGTGEQVR